MRKIIYLFSIYCLLYNAYCVAQVEDAGADVEYSDSAATKEIDVSDKHLKKLEKLQDFYISQNKKTKIPESLMMKYQTGLKNTEEEIALIREKRIGHAKKVQQTEPTLLETEIFKFNFRDMDLALRMNE